MASSFVFFSLSLKYLLHTYVISSWSKKSQSPAEKKNGGRVTGFELETGRGWMMIHDS